MDIFLLSGMTSD